MSIVESKIQSISSVLNKYSVNNTVRKFINTIYPDLLHNFWGSPMYSWKIYKTQHAIFLRTLSQAAGVPADLVSRGFGHPYFRDICIYKMLTRVNLFFIWRSDNELTVKQHSRLLSLARGDTNECQAEFWSLYIYSGFLAYCTIYHAPHSSSWVRIDRPFLAAHGVMVVHGQPRPLKISSR